MNHIKWLKYLIVESAGPKLDPRKYRMVNSEFREELSELLNKDKYFQRSLLKHLKEEALSFLKTIPDFYVDEIMYRIKEGGSVYNYMSDGQSIAELLESKFTHLPQAEPFWRMSPSLYFEVLRSIYLVKFSEEKFVQDLKYKIPNLAMFYFNFYSKYPNKLYKSPTLNKIENLRKKNLKEIGTNMFDDLSKIGKNSILDEVEIEEYISSGAYGSVYRLKDGRVLKLFDDSVDLKKDISRMETTIEEIFSSKQKNDEERISSEEMPYFDYGKIGTTKYYYAIMPLIVPIRKAPWFGLSEVFELVANTNQHVSRHLESSGIWDLPYQDYKDSVLVEVPRYMPRSVDRNDFTKYSGTIDKIIMASYRAYKKFKGTDTHSGNIGYLPQKPNELFYFDM
jgi:hypothetical protein